MRRRRSSPTAIEIFERNVASFPHSANVYDSLGEAQEKAGKLEQARESYGKAHRRGQEIHDPNVGIYRQNYDRVKATLAEGT